MNAGEMAGRYEIPLSLERRLKLREPFVSQNASLFLTNHINQEQHCLLALSPAYWREFLKELQTLRGQEGLLLQAFYGGGGYELALDNGEIVIPSPLLKWAGLKECVTLMEVENGVNRFELWDPKALPWSRI